MKRTFIKQILLTLCATLFCVAYSFGQNTVTTKPIAGDPFCSGTSISVAYEASGAFASGNVFTAQLSDESGGFDAPIATASGASPISIQIPSNAARSEKYAIRVIASSPATVGSVTPAFTINATPPTPYSGIYFPGFCVGDPPSQLKVSSLPGATIRWYNLDGTELNEAPSPNTSGPRSASQPYVNYSQTVNGCESPKGTISVGVLEIARPPIINDPSTCQYSNVTSEILSKAVSFSAPSGTGPTVSWYDAPTGGNFYSSVPTPSTAVAGTQDFYISQDYAMACPSPRVKLTLTVNSASPAPTAPSPTYSKGQTAPALSATGSQLKWYDSKTNQSPLPSAPIPNTTNTGKTSYWVTQNTNGCESERVEVVVTISDCNQPAKPIATTPIVYELNAKAVPLEAAFLAGAIKNWYGTNATGGDASPTAPTPVTASIGTISYYVSQTVAGCESDRTKIDVTVSACTPPKAPTVEPVSYTIGDKAIALTALGAAGATFKWYDSQSSTTPLNTAPTPLTNAAGTKSYFVTQTVGGCESAKAELVVTVSACTPPAKPTVASTITYVQGVQAPALTATPSAGGKLNWYGTNATGGNPTSTAPIPSTSTVGTTPYYVSQTIGACESERAKIDVIITCKVIAKPTVLAIAPVCVNTTVAASVLTNAVSPKSNLLWYTSADGGNGTASPAAPDTKTAGTKTYYVAQTANGCESERVAVSIEVKELPAAPKVTAAVAYCKDATNATALTAEGTGLKWYNAAGGTISAPKPSTAAVGETSFFVTQTETACESPKAEIRVKINALPANAVAEAEALCQEKEDKSYPFSATGTAGSTFNWYAAQTGGVKLDATPAINLKNAGETTSYVTQVDANGCESPVRVPKKIRVKKLPAQPTVVTAPIEYCQFIVAKALTATPETGGVLNWYGTNQTGGSAGPAPIPSTAEGGTTTYYVSQSLEQCEGERAKIDVKVNTTPKPTTKTYLEYCQNETAQALDATGTVLKWYRGANDTEFQGIPFIPFTEKVQDYSFFVTQTGSNGCESPKEEIKIHIKSLPSATISGNATIDLGQSANINIRFTGDGPWKYVLSNGDTATTNQSNHQVSVKPTTTTSYLITEVSNACGKGIPIGSAMVTVKVPTINSGSPSVSEICAGKQFTVPFQQSGDFPAGNSFKLQVATENADAKFYTIPSTSSNSAVTATFPDTTKGGTYYLRVISSGTNAAFLVKGSVSSITINASPLPVATLSGTQTILVGGTAELKTEITGRAPWIFTLNNGTKDTLITVSATPYILRLAPKTTTTYAITKVTNGCGTGNGVGTARVQVDPILGVEPATPANWAKVYPTVVNGKCTVEVTGSISPKQATIEIVDLNGRARSTQVIKEKKTDVDFGTYPSGLYLIRVRNGNLNTVQRVMKP